MKNTSVFDFSDYRDFLKSRMHEGERVKRGELSSLAEAISCQVSYLSRVMAGTGNLSPEQAERAGQHFGLSSEEGYQLLLLVMLARAGTPSLRSQLMRKIEQARTDRLQLQKRVGNKGAVSSEDQAVYYSHWYYAAVHVMSGIPTLQTKEAMARELRLPVSRVSEILDFLGSIGLVEMQREGSFRTGVGKIHLKRESAMIGRHHANWRLQALRSMEGVFDGLHYSVLVNTSRTDAETLRHKIAQFIQDFMEVVDPSADEEMHCFALDFFKPRA